MSSRGAITQEKIDFIVESGVYSKTKLMVAVVVEEKLKILLEEKHLYQSVRLSYDALVNRVSVELTNTYFPDVTNSSQFIADSLLNSSWHVDDPGKSRKGYIAFGDIPDLLESLEFKIAGIRTNCGNCNKVSPMNLIKATEVVSDSRSQTDFKLDKDHNVYTFAFQCQNCRAGIEVFIVARKYDKLTLVGRTPMERVQTPESIPNKQKKYYSGAIMAFNSGQVLPALFMLRTFIEQYTRTIVRQVEPDKAELDKVDVILKKYMEGLPDNFNSRVPSLKDVYNYLSIAIHEADESEDLFRESRTKIEKHLNTKRLLGL